MRFTQLTETVSKRPIPPHTTYLIAEAMVCDEEGEDVDVCHLSYILLELWALKTTTDPIPRHPHLSSHFVV